MECGGKRSATPLWMVSGQSQSREKRRRASLASLAAALQGAVARQTLFTQIGLHSFPVEQFQVCCVKFIHQWRMRQSLSIERNCFGDAYGAD